MSAVSVRAATFSEVTQDAGQAQVIDLGEERSKRLAARPRARSAGSHVNPSLRVKRLAESPAGLQTAIRRHPAGSAMRAAKSTDILTDYWSDAGKAGAVTEIQTQVGVDRRSVGSYSKDRRTDLRSANFHSSESRQMHNAASVSSSPAPTAAAMVWRVPLHAKVLGWVLAFGLVTASALGIGMMVRPAPYQGETWIHTVAAGESLWGLAASVGSDRPVEDIVEDIRAMNYLESATLMAGQEITLPVD